ncbi:hypothetical protein CGCSCA1_v000906 [Colletotrichum siamense]|nr:hypothetical protein CGCSCA1_v000906 [Colletotrichum siamense]
MASHIIFETSFDEHEIEKGLCIFQYIHDLQSAASRDLVRDPDHSLLQWKLEIHNSFASDFSGAPLFFQSSPYRRGLSDIAKLFCLVSSRQSLLDGG